MGDSLCRKEGSAAGGGAMAGLGGQQAVVLTAFPASPSSSKRHGFCSRTIISQPSISSSLWKESGNGAAPGQRRMWRKEPGWVRGFTGNAVEILKRNQALQSVNHRSGCRALKVQARFLHDAAVALQAQPSTWTTAALVNACIFVVGAPLLRAGLTGPAVAAAFLLGTATWRAFGGGGFAIVALYFVLGSAVTKVRLKQKEAEGIAEKRSGRRGPGSVVGSGVAGLLCALAACLPLKGLQSESAQLLLRLGFVASFSTKLSDTTASEIGKAFGRTTYLVTTLAKVPRGTEGAVSLEGTVAGLLGACILTSVAALLGLVDLLGAVACIVASQIANYGESIVGATLQDKPGYEWMTNDVVNVINICTGTVLAVLLRASWR